MANWWDEAYDNISKWSVNPDQLNPDRGAYRDAFLLSTAEKGMNYNLTSDLMRKNTDQEKELMDRSADLDRRNTLDTMTAEHTFKVAGMQESNRLGKDYLAAEGYQQRETLAEEGYQQREGQKVVNEGQRDVENIRAGSSRYAQDSETSRAFGGYASAERQIGLKGNQDRETIRTQGDEQRRNTAFEREHAAGLATRMSRR